MTRSNLSCPVPLSVELRKQKLILPHAHSHHRVFHSFLFNCDAPRGMSGGRTTGAPSAGCPHTLTKASSSWNPYFLAFAFAGLHLAHPRGTALHPPSPQNSMLMAWKRFQGGGSYRENIASALRGAGASTLSFGGRWGGHLRH